MRISSEENANVKIMDYGLCEMKTVFGITWQLYVF